MLTILCTPAKLRNFALFCVSNCTFVLVDCVSICTVVLVDCADDSLQSGRGARFSGLVRQYLYFRTSKANTMTAICRSVSICTAFCTSEVSIVLYTYIRIHIYKYTYTYIYIYIYHLHIYTYTYIYIYVYTCT